MEPQTCDASPAPKAKSQAVSMELEEEEEEEKEEEAGEEAEDEAGKSASNKKGPDSHFASVILQEDDIMTSSACIAAGCNEEGRAEALYIKGKDGPHGAAGTKGKREPARDLRRFDAVAAWVGGGFSQTPEDFDYEAVHMPFKLTGKTQVVFATGDDITETTPVAVGKLLCDCAKREGLFKQSDAAPADVKNLLWAHSSSWTKGQEGIRVAKAKGKEYYFDASGVAGLAAILEYVRQANMGWKSLRWSWVLYFDTEKKRFAPIGLALTTLKKRKLNAKTWFLAAEQGKGELEMGEDEEEDDGDMFS